MEDESLSKILFLNLHLLGLDIEVMEGKYHIAFNKEMFNLPNKAGSEAVLQFLFDRLNPRQCKDWFRDCWPVVDRKSEMQFRKVCNTWLSMIHDDHPEAHIPHNRASLLLTPGGHKYTDLLYRLSNHVLVQVMTKEHGFDLQGALQYPSMSQSSAFGDVMKSALTHNSQQLKSAYLKQLHVVMEGNRKWKADELISRYRHLCRTRKDLENEKRQQVKTQCEHAQKQGLSLPVKRTVSMFDSDQDIYSLNREKRMKRARSQWKQLHDFNDTMNKNREILRSILDPNSSKPGLNGTDLGVRVPSKLLQDFQREIQEQEIDSVYIEGQLNLESLLHLWNMCLTQYRVQFKKDTQPNLTEEIPELTAQKHQYHSHLQTAQKLREDIKDVALPKVQDRVRELHEKLKRQRKAGNYKNFSNNENSSPGLTAPTPPVMFPSRISSGETPTGPATTLKSKKDTPDAVSSVLDRIEESVNRNAVHLQLSKQKYLASRLQALQKSTKPSAANQREVEATNKKTSKSVDIKGKVRVAHNQPAKKTQDVGSLSESSLISDKDERHKADDLLANWVVRSVIDSDSEDKDFWDSELKSSYSIMESPHNTGQDPFISKDVLSSSQHGNSFDTSANQIAETFAQEFPQSPVKSFKRKETQMVSGLFSPFGSSPKEDEVTLSDRGDNEVPSRQLLSPALFHQSSSLESVQSPDLRYLRGNAPDLTAVSNQDKISPWRKGSSTSLQFPIADSEQNGNFLSYGAERNHCNVHANETAPGLWSHESPKYVSEIDKAGSITIDYEKPESVRDILTYTRDLGESSGEQSPIYKSRRFPGDGHASYESETSASSDTVLSTKGLESFSKDSLLSTAIDKQTAVASAAPFSIDDLIFSAGESTLIDGNVSNASASVTIDSEVHVSRTISAKADAEGVDVASDYNLDLDSGDDDALLDLGDFYTPVKGGIVLDSTKSSDKNSSAVKFDGSFQSSKGSLGPKSLFSSKSYNDSPHAALRVENLIHGQEMVKKEEADDIQTQMAVLQERVAKILNSSSDDD